MARTILVGNTRTGGSLTAIPVSGATWSIEHRGYGEISVDIPLNAGEFRNLEKNVAGVWRPTGSLRSALLTALEPVENFMAILEGDNVLAAGPIWAHDYSWETGVLKIKASGSIGSLFDHRYVMGVLGSGWASWSATYSSLSLGTIAKRLIELMETHTGGDLPIILPADEVSTHTRTYNGFELATVQSRLDDIMGVENGPDIRFDPRLTTDRLGIEWVMRTGTVAQPLLVQAGDDHTWDFRLPRSGVSGLSVQRDATRIASRSWATGSGTDEALLMSRADDPTLTDAGFPLLEVADSRSSVELQATLDEWASGNLLLSARPMTTVSATVQSNHSPQLGTYRVGDFAKLWIPADHPYLSLLWPLGYSRVRIIGISGDLDPTVSITFAPIMEGR